MGETKYNFENIYSSITYTHIYLKKLLNSLIFSYTEHFLYKKC